jgi:hypothetical protein
LQEHAVSIPEKFVYVCTATREAVVNLIPPYRLGLPRISKLVVLCGVLDEENLVEGERLDAVQPARWLSGSFARRDLTLDPKRDVLVLYGDPDKVLAWREHANTIAALGLPVVINLSGGPKQVSFGIDLFLRPLMRDAGLSYVSVHVSKYPALARAVCDVGGETHEHDLDGGDIVPFETVLRSKGQQLKAPSREDLDYSAFLGAHRSDILAIGSRAFPNGGAGGVIAPQARTACMIVNRVNAARDKKDEPLEFFPQQAKCVEEFLDPDRKLGLVAKDKVLPGPQKKVCTGGWLETYLAAYLRDEFPDLAIQENLQICLSGIGRDFSEMDVALRKREQLHIIELKSSARTTGLGDALSKLGGKKANFCGRPGMAWFVAPFMTMTAGEAADYEARARQFSVKLLYGPNAIAELVEDIRSLP